MGNLDAKRDWGFAGDYVEAMWLMLQQDDPDDYVVSTGVQHSIHDLLDIAFSAAEIQGWTDYVETAPAFKRPAELHSLCGNNSKAKNILGWQPKTSFKELVQMMVEEDIKRYSK